MGSRLIPGPTRCAGTGDRLLLALLLTWLLLTWLLLTIGLGIAICGHTGRSRRCCVSLEILGWRSRAEVTLPPGIRSGGKMTSGRMLDRRCLGSGLIGLELLGLKLLGLKLLDLGLPRLGLISLDAAGLELFRLGLGHPRAHLGLGRSIALLTHSITSISTLVMLHISLGRLIPMLLRILLLHLPRLALGKLARMALVNWALVHCPWGKLAGLLWS